MDRKAPALRAGVRPIETAELDNPFPSGYAEDLLQEPDTDDPYNPFPPGYADDLEE